MNSPHGRPTKWRDRIDCGCKINLRLKVTARRPDGLHDLSSCFLFLNEPGDTLTISDGGAGIAFECPGHPALAGENNIACRAAQLFAAAAGIAPAWHIVLEKNVPLAAGLGGGSADAAGVLLLLNRRYQALDPGELEKIAFSLGADVPFFLHRQAAWITGAGENVAILDELPPLPEILIVNPAFPVSAKWAYTHLAKELIGADDPALPEKFVSGRIGDWRGFCRNDLAPAVMKKFPLLGLLEQSFYASGALCVQVSGSGPSLFALFEKDAGKAAAELRQKFAGFHALRIFTQCR